MLPDGQAVQTHPTKEVYCTCPSGWHPSPNPRNETGCVRCGRPKEPVTTLPEHVEALFGVLAEVLESSGDKERDHPDPTFDYIRTRTMQRVRWGQERFGEAWREKDKPEEAKQEGLDWFVYLMGECAEAGNDPDLFDALHKMYQGLVAVLRYQARRRGSP